MEIVAFSNLRIMFVFYFCFGLIISFSFAQNCKTPGGMCNDDKQCCGGCCIQGTCISTYQNCEEVQDLCLENYCAPGFECYILNPSPDCIGCNIQKDCRPF